MTTITTSTQSADEIKAAFESRGIEIVEDGQQSQQGDAGDKSAPTKAPGDPSVDASRGESGSASEADKQANTGKSADEDKTKSPADEETGSRRGRHGFKARVDKLEERILRLADDLELERGDKKRLREELDAKTRELAELTGEGTGKPVAKTDELVRPKRPTLADFEFDQEKFDAAMSQYDEALETYYAKVAENKAQKAWEEKEAKRVAEQQQAAAEKEFGEFVARRDADRKLLTDYDDLMEALPDKFKLPDLIEGTIQLSDRPAFLIHYFMTDTVDKDGVELERISKLNPVQQVRELTRLEAKLVAEHSEKKPAAGEKDKTPVAAQPADQKVIDAAPPADKAPVRPKTPKPADPIEPVGSRTSGSQASLGEAKSFMEYMRMRRAGTAR